MKIVVLGDAHLRDQTWTNVRLYGDTAHAAREVVEAAKRLEAVLVQPGDLFDAGLNLETPRVLRCAAEMFLDVPDVVYTVGNHDRPKSIAGRANPEWADILGLRRPAPDDPGTVEAGPRWHFEEGVVHEVQGVKFACLHHVYGKQEFDVLLESFLAGGPKFDVLVMHQYLKEVFGVAGAWEADSEDMAAKLEKTGCRLVVCGHTHISKHWVEGGVTFVSPGSTCHLSTRAALECAPEELRYPVIELPPEGAAAVEWSPITRVRRVEAATVLPDGDSQTAALNLVDELVAWRGGCGLPADLSVPYLEVRCDPMRDFTDRMRERAGADVHLQFVWTAAVDGGQTPVLDAAAEAEGDTLAERLIRSQYPEGELRDTLLEICAGEDVDRAVERRIEKLTA